MSHAYVVQPRCSISICSKLYLLHVRSLRTFANTQSECLSRSLYASLLALIWTYVRCVWPTCSDKYFSESKKKTDRTSSHVQRTHAQIQTLHRPKPESLCILFIQCHIVFRIEYQIVGHVQHAHPHAHPPSAHVPTSHTLTCHAPSSSMLHMSPKFNTISTSQRKFHYNFSSRQIYTSSIYYPF